MANDAFPANPTVDTSSGVNTLRSVTGGRFYHTAGAGMDMFVSEVGLCR